jgi:hypothetical protein
MMYKFLKIYIVFFVIIFQCSNCTNPIEKKKKELENCKVSIISADIVKFNFLFFPPVPKIHFKVNLEILNTNDVEVSIEKFSFKVYKKFPEKTNPLQIATIGSKEEIVIQALSKKELELDLITTFEESEDKDIFKSVLLLGKSALQNEDIEFELDGIIEYNTIAGKFNIPYSSKFKTKVR